MIKAILIDLDDTLIQVADSFVTEYLTLADSFFEARWGYSSISHLLTLVAGDKAGPRPVWETITETAANLIQKATARSTDEIRTAFESFYTQVYPRLMDCIEPAPGARQLLDWVRSQPCALAIATNPLYPAEALRQRLDWGGLGDIFDHALVTNSDIMHFAKPDAAYYAEIIARVGVEPDEAIMVGDSYENDILPAAVLGLHTFWVRSGGTSSAGNKEVHHGSLVDFAQHIMQPDGLELWTPTPLRPAAIEPELRGNLGALFGMLAEVKPHQWRQHPDPNEWSILQIVCHLLESEISVQQPRLRRIHSEDNPFLVNPAPPPGPREFKPCDEDGLHAARLFAEQRHHLIEWLGTLQAEDWNRPARHSVFGPTTLLEMAHFTAQHDRLHLNQLCQTLGRCQ